MSERVLLTDSSTPIYHNPTPIDPDAIELKNRWKGLCLFEYYETGQMRFWEGGEAHNELSRYVVAWDGDKPVSVLDGVWCASDGWKGADAVLAPGTTDEVRNAFRAWVTEHPDNSFGMSSLCIDQKVSIETVRGSVEDAKREMATLFDTYFTAAGDPK